MIKALGKNVILKGTTKKSVIAVDNQDAVTVEAIKVFSIGDEVKSVIVGQDVSILRPILQQTERLIIPELGAEAVQGEFYMAVKEDEIIGIY